MKVLRLEKTQNQITRHLYEQVFPEDEAAFLDYYYFIKARENEILVIEEDDEIRSMIHLNPFKMSLNSFHFTGHYIVAVATQKEYRKRGYMGKLLKESFELLYKNKEPFTFLMPAAEAIYAPYDFRFIYNQIKTRENISIVKFLLDDSNMKESPNIKKSSQRLENFTDIKIFCLDEATLSNGNELSAFFTNQVEKKYRTLCIHDEQYYQMMILEQQAQNGGVKIVKYENQLIGSFAYSIDKEKIFIREFLIKNGFSDYIRDILKTFIKEQLEKNPQLLELSIMGIENQDSLPFPIQQKPMIMARIIHLPTLLATLQVREREVINCSIAILDSYITKNSRIWNLSNRQGESTVLVKETEDSQAVITIGALTSFLFGYKTLDEIKSEPDVILSDFAVDELKKLQLFQPILLNEVV